MKNGIRKILEFIKKIMPLIIIIVIFLAIKFHPKFLTITNFLGITNKQEDVSNLISYIELFIECGFLYFALKEFEMTRTSFEWQEEEYKIKVEKEAERKLKVICGFIYQWLEGHIFHDKTMEQLCNNTGELHTKQEDLVSFLKFLNKFSIPDKFFYEYVIDFKIEENNKNYKNEYLAIVRDIIYRKNIMTFTDYFSQNKKEAYKKIKKCYDNIHNYWEQQITGDINDEIMIGMIWKKEK